MARVKIENLSKKFGDIVAVDNLSLEIADGESIGLLGPSGCGKSTTLYCISGLEEPTAGKIFFDDILVNHLSPRDRDIAMVFQDYALYPHLNVYENLAFALRMRKMDKNEVDVKSRESARLLDIEFLFDRYPSELSGGQRQRVALGRAIVRDPILFLMDEPLSNLDAGMRVKTRMEIKALQKRLGTTMVFVTHDQEEAMVISDRIALMRDGALQQFDFPNEIYNNPESLYVATFIGSPKMNILSGQLKVAENHGLFAFEDAKIEFPVGIIKNRRIDDFRSGRKAMLGVRPQDINIYKERKPGDRSAIEGEVYITEPIGQFTYVDVRFSGQIVKAATDPSLNVQRGDHVTLEFDENRLYLFDPDTELRI